MKRLAFLILVLASTAEAQFKVVHNESTAAARRLPVYLETDAGAAATGITISGSECRYFEAQGAGANCAGTITEREAGFYSYELAASEVDTVGQHTIWIDESGIKPFLVTYEVLKEWDDTITAVGANTVTLNTSAPAINGGIRGDSAIYMLSGNCAGQNRCVIDYDSTRVATILPFTGCTPSIGDKYVIAPQSNCGLDTEIRGAAYGIASGTASAANKVLLQLDQFGTSSQPGEQAAITMLTGVAKGETRCIASFNGTTDEATVQPAFSQAPQSGNRYIIQPAPYCTGVFIRQRRE